MIIFAVILGVVLAAEVLVLYVYDRIKFDHFRGLRTLRYAIVLVLAVGIAGAASIMINGAPAPIFMVAILVVCAFLVGSLAIFSHLGTNPSRQ